MTKKAIIMGAMAAMLVVGGCAKKAPKDLPPPPACCGPEETDRVVPGSQQDFVTNLSSDRIFFGFDQYNVDAEDMATLQS